MENKLNPSDGFFITPYTPHDFGVITLAFFGYLLVMYLNRKSKHIDNPDLQDWLGTFVFVVIFTICFYEYGIHIKMPFGLFLPGLGVGILICETLVKWIFLTKDGKSLIIATFKEILSVFLGRLGYTKKDDDNNSSQ